MRIQGAGFSISALAKRPTLGPLRLGLTHEEGHVPLRVGQLLGREVLVLRRAPARWHARVRLDELALEVEAHRGARSARAFSRLCRYSKASE